MAWSKQQEKQVLTGDTNIISKHQTPSSSHEAGDDDYGRDLRFELAAGRRRHRETCGRHRQLGWKDHDHNRKGLLILRISACWRLEACAVLPDFIEEGWLLINWCEASALPARNSPPGVADEMLPRGGIGRRSIDDSSLAREARAVVFCGRHRYLTSAQWNLDHGGGDLC
ncbi:hypothetical protein BHM03_00057784 [Ensete ventricosum]|nr:hypothetical protein BHM03_00057784 [Ensete ventricosum]